MRAVILALAMAASADASSNPVIAGYAAGSDVWQHNRIDLSAEAMYSFLNNKYPRGCTVADTYSNSGSDSCSASGVALDATFTTAERFKLAHDMYDGGGGKSSDYVEYEATGADAAMTESPGDFQCTQKSTGGGAPATSINLGKLALKSKTPASWTGVKDIKVYLDHPYWTDKKCGQVPFQIPSGTTTKPKWTAGTGLTGSSFDVNDASDGSYVNRDIYKAADCPTGTTGALGSTNTIVCAAGNAQTITFDVDNLHAPSYGSRTLKGFSTAVEAKMVKATKQEPEGANAKFFHGTGSYADTTIQAALAAMIADPASGSEQTKFSTCVDGSDKHIGTDDGACPAGEGKHWDATGSKCYAAEKAACPSGSTWTQGSALCKDATTHKFIALAWAGVSDDGAADKAACIAAGGLVTDFQEYYSIIEDGLFSRMGIETVQKLSIYGNAWLYTVHEFEDAIADCVADDIGDNDAGVHAWDEGVAFWTGSIVGESAVQNGGGKGVMIYALANKRCENFHTCLGDTSTTTTKGQSTVNVKLFEKFTYGKNAIHANDCGAATVALRDTIIPQMTVPLIQGTLRYAYKIGMQSDATSKSWAEGYAFMMSVIHRVGACSIKDANKIYKALDIPAARGDLGTLGGSMTFDDVKLAFEKNYECMGVTCADVGSLYSGGAVLVGAAACTDPASAGSTTAGEEKEVLPTWAIIAIAAAGFLMVVFFGMMCAYKSSKDMTIKMYNDLKKEGARV